MLDWFDHAQPGEYWSSLDVSRSLDRIRVPALHISGWYDTFFRGSIDGFLALCDHAGSALARKNQYLVAGPWLHIPWGDRIGAADFGAEALLDTDAILLRWFNHWLKDSGEFAASRAFATSFWERIAGARRKRGRADAKYALYLHSAGRANSRKGDGALSAIGAANRRAVRHLRLRSRSAGTCARGAGCRGRAVRPGGAGAGQQRARLHDRAARRAAADFRHAARRALLRHFLGAHRLHRQAGARAAQRRRRVHLHRHRAIQLAFAETGYTADKIHHWEFDLEPTSCCFAAGDRIRLEIASSAFPLYDRNPGTAVPSCRATSWDWRRSTQIVYHDRDHPSALYLPVSEAAE